MRRSLYIGLILSLLLMMLLGSMAVADNTQRMAEMQ